MLSKKSVSIAVLGLVLGMAHIAAAQEPQTTAPVASSANASVPRLVQFNGTLKDLAAGPLNGAASVTFAIYAEQDGGTPLWSETQNVIADANGHFNALLGGATANGMPAGLFGTGQSRWLGITIARSPEMPRVLLASVPYALKAGDADTLGGLPPSEYVTAKSLAASNARATPPIVSSGGSTTIIATPQSSVAPAGAASPDAIPQATPTGTGTTNFIPIWTSSSVLGNSTIFESAGLVGIGTKTPAETLDVNGNSIFRGSFQLPPGHEATAASGFESHSFQFQSSSFNSSTHKASDKAFGFRAEPIGNNTSNPSSKLDLFFGGAGGTLADTGFSWSSTGVVTFAPGQSFPGTSATLNVLNLPDTSSAAGVVTMGGQPFINNFGSTTNLFVGENSGGSFATTSAGTFNTALGTQSLLGNTTGFSNTAIGGQAMYFNTTGGANAAIGTSALSHNTTGIENTALGRGAAISNTTGSHNTLVGADTDLASNNLDYATAIGYGAVVGANNTVVLGGLGVAAVNVGIGQTGPRQTLDVTSTKSGSVSAPVPTLGLNNYATGSSQAVAIQFNPDAGTNALPGAQIIASPNGGGSELEFLARQTPSTQAVTLVVDPFGNVQVKGSLFVSGEATINGSVSKGGGTFKIDDPIDPAGKYLSHSFVESPDMKDIYDGIVVTDAAGNATVEMPEWFSALNRDFRYQLTVVGQFAQAIISSEIADNHFSIRTDKPGVKVSWMITGIRQDAYANAHRTPIEEVKPPAEQGHYLHPELFGAPPEMSVENARNAAAHQTAGATERGSTPANAGASR